jgi:hypothetical protein
MMSLSLDVQFLLSDVFDFQNDPTFSPLLAGLHELSKKHLSLLVRTLMTWKTRQITEVEKLKVRLQKDSKIGNMSIKEALILLEERHQFCVDYTFLSVLQSIFKVHSIFSFLSVTLTPLAVRTAHLQGGAGGLCGGSAWRLGV